MEKIRRHTRGIALLAALLLAPQPASAGVQAEQADELAPASMDQIMREIRPSSSFLPRQEDGIINRFDDLDYEGLKSVLTQFKPWSLTFYARPDSTVPVTQAIQAGGSFPDYFTAETDKVFLFGDAADSQRYEVTFLRDHKIKDLPVGRIPADRLHVMVVAKRAAAPEHSTQTIRPALSGENAEALAHGLSQLPDVNIPIRMRLGERSVLAIRVDPANEFQMGTVSPDSWTMLLQRLHLPDVQLTASAIADLQQLSPADTAALLSAVRMNHGIARILGIQVRQRSNGERYLFLFV